MRGNKKEEQIQKIMLMQKRRNQAMDSLCISAMGEQETGTAESIS
jgi:uncharacterized protein YeaC (DUF1315 family)